MPRTGPAGALAALPALLASPGLERAFWIALALVAVLAPRGTVVMLVLYVLIAGRPIALARALPRLAATPLGLALAALSAWMFLSLLWAPDPRAALDQAIGKALLFLLGLAALETAGRRPDVGGPLLFCFVAMVLMLLDLLSGGRLAMALRAGATPDMVHLNNAASVLAVMVFPALAWLRRNPAVPLRPGLVWAAAAAMTIVLPMAASALAVLVGGAVALLTARWGPRVPATLVAVFAVCAVALPWVVPAGGAKALIEATDGRVPFSWAHRLETWHVAASHARPRPLFGNGLGASRYIGERIDTITLTTRGETRTIKRLSLHPHSAALQLWLELGVVGLALGLAVLGVVTRAVLRLAPDRAAFAPMAGGLFAALVIMSVSYGLWQSWWLSVLFLAAAAVAPVGGAARAGHATRGTP